MEKEKIVLDWKAPSERKMMDLVEELTDAEKLEFAKKCTVDKDGKRVIKKSEGKKWIKDKFDGKDVIEWKNLPKGTKKKPSISDTLEMWLKL